MKNISLDLDNTIFDLEPVYKMGFKDFPQHKYTPPISWAVYECYPRQIADKILGYFRTIENYQTPLLNDKYPQLVNEWQQKYNIKFITSRRSNEPDVCFFDGNTEIKISWARYQTYKQILNSGIRVSMNNVIDVNGNTKIEAIKNNNIDLVIDDGPIVIEECLDANIDCVMISTNKTPYNHYLREKTLWAKNLFEVAKIKTL